MSLPAKISLEGLSQLLTHGVGQQVATDAVRVASTHLGLDAEADELSREQALAVLEDIAKSPGIVGITARFAKSRLFLVREPAREAAAAKA